MLGSDGINILVLGSFVAMKLLSTARTNASFKERKKPLFNSLTNIQKSVRKKKSVRSFIIVKCFRRKSVRVSLHDIVKRDAKDHHNWNYEEKTGPKHWPEMFKKCGGSRQSPIDIQNSEVDLNDELDAFEFDNYDDPLEDATIENNGHTVQISPGPKDAPRIIDEGGMDDKYQFLQLHFHWGSDSKKGSEHLIDGQRFPLEMHFVHMNTNYKTKEKASTKEDGLAVLAVLFKLSDKDNPALEPIIDKLDDIRTEGSKVDMDDFTLESLLPDDLMPYYRYEGSLTTPPCSEIVTWTIFKDFVPISEKQLQQFRNVKEEDEGEAPESLVDNFRMPQPLHGRVVEVSGEGNSAGIIGPSVVMVLSALSFLL
ncbi:carbonic anhydrase [Trichonephila inaurata madagascariensis]|uniref:Carbonic anhydrase n=1 Tax=Trichonephila inaurata madagascariensis TaxID=2747483 RepID=A0A8X7CE68_9ARAC|nr:carbonic anhydrase [Trichonephila inaurata madagascariensis]